MSEGGEYYGKNGTDLFIFTFASTRHSFKKKKKKKNLRHAGDHWVIFRLAVYLSCIVRECSHLKVQRQP